MSKGEPVEMELAGRSLPRFDREPLLEQRKIGLGCELLLKGLGQSLGKNLRPDPG
jgi:hypothetical protein